MKMKMFSVYDGKAQAFAAPFFMPAVGVAIRAFTDLANDKNTSVAKHPTDYSLFEIGEFDDGDASVVRRTPPLNLGLASSFIDNYKAPNVGKVEVVKAETPEVK